MVHGLAAETYDRVELALRLDASACVDLLLYGLGEKGRGWGYRNSYEFDEDER